mmetsp:Transcript_9733/g.21684  ORF Transcript_9733/g.21684 Transcript_9733/m.21684 type:complete len:283 (-) Transcript_9733:647-1495(-)
MFLSTLTMSFADSTFNFWCASNGISAPSAQVITTPLSVAGRGVFAMKPILHGETVVSIPAHLALTPLSGASNFSLSAKKLGKSRRKLRPWYRRFTAFTEQEGDPDDLWLAELTAYSLEALKEGHPWAKWISEWERDDPVQRLLESNPVWPYIDKVLATADELQELVPEFCHKKIQLGLHLRLERLNRHMEFIDPDDVFAFAKIHTILSSRVVDLGNDVTGIIPFHDMINHSLDDPNLELAFDFDGEVFKMQSTRDIREGEEIFISYTTVDEVLDEDKAIWVS